MKKILGFSIMSVLCLAAMSIFHGCKNEELDTDQYGGQGVAISAVAPNPVMRGGTLTIYGNMLEQVKEVRFAGDVSASSMTVVKQGAHGEMTVVVPLEGPEVGPVTIVDASGKEYSSFADLEFTEPIEISSFSPSTVLSGDVVTVSGEYLNVVREVKIGDAIVTGFESQSRHELTFIVPATATTSYLILGDVDETTDQTTIPNLIYSETKIEVGDPLVTVADKATYKSGDVITVEGEHLDMISAVNLSGAPEVDFTVASDAKSLSFNLPSTATDGNMVLVSYAGKEFVAGEIETVTVSSLSVESLAADGRYKAGCTVKITGGDLDLVKSVGFTGGGASFYYEEGAIYTTQPQEAQDGVLTLTLDSGKQAWTDPIEVVKPLVSSIDKNSVSTGDVVTVSGTDLDLVTSVTIGDKAHTFIDCAFEATESSVSVTIPRAAYDGPLTLASAAGYTAETEGIAVAYSEPVSITFSSPTYQMGKLMDFSGEDLMQIEQIRIKGYKITSYLLHTDTGISFMLPEELGPGVQRLDLVLVDGTEMTWPVPFEIVAPFSETFIWEGNEDLGSWSNKPTIGAESAFLDAGIAVGDIVRIYYTPYADWWQFQLFDGHWNNLNLPELGGNNTVSRDNTEPGAAYFSFEVTDANIGMLTSVQGWGGAMVLQGENVVVTGISLVQFGLTETVVWEGSLETGDYANNLEIGAESAWADAGLTIGSQVRVYFTAQNPDEWSMQLFDGHWNKMDMLFPDSVNPNQFNPANSPDAISDGFVSFEVTETIYNLLTSVQGWGCGMIIQGKFLTITKLAFI